MKHTSKVIKISLSLALMVFVLTMTPASTFLQITKQAMAATLTSIAVLPSNNIVNTRTTYDIIFQTATTGTIKTIQMDFPSGFDVSAATRVIEKADIGSGSLSAPSSSTLLYTVGDAVSVPAGTKIRLEIGKIINSDTEGSFFKVGITTKDAAGGTIDGPTLSPSIPIKDITGDDISPSFMVRKTLNDDAAGNAKGWNPNDATLFFTIADTDIVGPADTTYVEASEFSGERCRQIQVNFDAGTITIRCETPPNDGDKLHYLITKLPANIVTSSVSASSSPFDSLQNSQNVFPPSLP